MQVTAGFLRFNIFNQSLNFGTNAAKAMGLGRINEPKYAGGLATGLGRTTLAGYTFLGDDNSTPNHQIDNTYQVAPSLSWTRGSHTLKFGARFIRRDLVSIQSASPDANFAFSSVLTNDTENATGKGGNAFASMLLGYPTSVSRTLSLIAPTYQIWEPGMYVQDDWHGPARRNGRSRDCAGWRFPKTCKTSTV